MLNVQACEHKIILGRVDCNTLWHVLTQHSQQKLSWVDEVGTMIRAPPSALPSKIIPGSKHFTCLPF